MWTYILKRLLLMIPTLFGIVLVTFIVLQLVPGGPVERMMAQLRAGTRGRESGAASLALHADQRARTEIQQEQVEYFQKLYGFDKPVHVQFGTWLVRLFTFDFGESYYRHKKVVDLVLEKLPVSVSLGAWSFVLTYLTCIPLGIRKAVQHGSRFDAITSMLILFGYSIPGFVLGIFLIVLFGGGSFWTVFPLRGLTSDGFADFPWWQKVLDYLWHLVLPLTCEVIGSFAVLTLLTKNSFLDEIHRQYVQTARARGLSPRRVLFKHVFRNAISRSFSASQAVFSRSFSPAACSSRRYFPSTVSAYCPTNPSSAAIIRWSWQRCFSSPCWLWWATYCPICLSFWPIRALALKARRGSHDLHSAHER
jgi:microcin C transport system permease protein